MIFKEPEGTVAGVDPLKGRNKRDVLAYPYHVKNYKVNPFKETDWNDFWAQVEYDWDTGNLLRGIVNWSWSGTARSVEQGSKQSL